MTEQEILLKKLNWLEQQQLDIKLKQIELGQETLSTKIDNHKEKTK